jgi:hypothetical protein
MVEWELIEYTPNETARLVADPELQRDLQKFSIRTVARVALVSEDTVKAGRRKQSGSAGP